MKYYDEARMKDIREALEARLRKWPGVVPKEMMGCLVYFHKRKFFAFLVTYGIVVTKLSERDRTELEKRVKSKPFEMAGKTSSNWIQVTVQKPEDLDPVLPYVRESYEETLDQ